MVHGTHNAVHDSRNEKIKIYINGEYYLRNEAKISVFDSGYLDPYQYYTLSFDEIGTFDYFCELHPWMFAQVIVE